MLRVMIVDDDLAILETLQDFISLLDNLEIVASASSLPQALALLEEIDLDLLITDLHIANESGLNLANKFRAKREGGFVIIMTASADPSDQSNALSAGIDIFLSKTSLVTDLIGAIDQAQAAIFQPSTHSLI